MRIGINGVGRIGKAIFRANASNPQFEVVAVNDINSDIGNIEYQLNYDTIYDRLETPVAVSENGLRHNGKSIRVFNNSDIHKVPWDEVGVDVVIDASGVHKNVLNAQKLIELGKVKKVVVTHSPDEVDCTLVLGASEELYDPNAHHVISSSICDATALAPVLKALNDSVGLVSGYITTLHPWLNYQNLNDGPASSWSFPGEIYHHYALGRSVTGNMIPKPTTAVQATVKVLPELSSVDIGSFSYRTPTAIVGSADITLRMKKTIQKDDILKLFVEAQECSNWNIFSINMEPLVSLDFKKSNYSCIVDHRWTDVVGGDTLKLILWYDNEWGYASRVCDIVKYVGDRGI